VPKENLTLAEDQARTPHTPDGPLAIVARVCLLPSTDDTLASYPEWYGHGAIPRLLPPHNLAFQCGESSDLTLARKKPAVAGSDPLDCLATFV